jgi:hypothetical protein
MVLGRRTGALREDYSSVVHFTVGTGRTVGGSIVILFLGKMSIYMNT